MKKKKKEKEEEKEPRRENSVIFSLRGLYSGLKYLEMHVGRCRTISACACR